MKQLKIKQKTKKWIFPILLGKLLGILENTLTGKGVIRAGEGVITAGQNI